jgi:hypothetical protein
MSAAIPVRGGDGLRPRALPESAFVGLDRYKRNGYLANEDEMDGRNAYPCNV